jgi:hypothetical protein
MKHFISNTKYKITNARFKKKIEFHEIIHKVGDGSEFYLPPKI